METLNSIKLKGLFFILLVLGFNFQSHSQGSMGGDNSVAVNIIDGDLDWGNCPDFMPEGCKVSILNGDPSAKNADAVFKIQPNTDLPEHWHNSAERMILIEGEMDVTYEGESTKTLKAGYYAYGPEKKPHKARCNDSGPCYLFVAFEKPVDAFPGKAK